MDVLIILSRSNGKYDGKEDMNVSTDDGDIEVLLP